MQDISTFYKSYRNKIMGVKKGPRVGLWATLG